MALEGIAWMKSCSQQNRCKLKDKMNIKYYYAERKYNEFEEQIFIKGYSPIIDMDFHTLITRLNQVADLVD